MTEGEFHSIVAALRASAGIAAKRDIADVAGRLRLSGQPVAVGDDCAAIPDGDGYLLLAIEGFMNEFVAGDPWFAGWCGVMVNLSDIAAMGGRPIAVVDAIWAREADGAEPVLAGLGAASEAFGVPIVGGHTNLKTDRGQLSVAVLGRAKRLLTSFDARPGERLVAAVDHRGAYREPFDNWQAATTAPPGRLRGDLDLLPQIAEAGWSSAAKDISQGGIVGTAIMLAECSGVGIDIDLDCIPLPAGVALARWLATFPSYGYLLSVPEAHVENVLGLFAGRDLTAAVIGEVRAGSAIHVVSSAGRALIRDHAAEPLMRFDRGEAAR
ncbi:sll0787 family AIR synthase-like protein [Rhizobiaceae bacterium BDR2-2]|uniref:Sll0787 family AIR synthase-like protein n=1 Tax=Ectorhizobium quercum TaxID=2965071 RepID=A0AAE3N4D4_9HYPH|nr:sll0787 family AIR synthase-like protein [Ectorhizobium quercum]MCX8999721.1 sll0787 family AIR synthase-like protein [Ectorhizobium quercum]